MPLKEINDHITNLRYIEVISWVWHSFHNLIFINRLSDFSNIFGSKLGNHGLQGSFTLRVVRVIFTKNTQKVLIFIICWKHIHFVAVMTMKLAITAHALDSCSRLQTSIACVVLIIHKIIYSSFNINPLILDLIIANKWINPKTLFMEKETTDLF